MEVSVRQLKNHLSEYLRSLEAGGEIVVTSRGRPVARLLPPICRSEDQEAAALARLDAQPWIRAGDGAKVRGSDRPAPWPSDEKPLSQLVLDERE